jgi:hypothetical protein
MCIFSSSGTATLYPERCEGLAVWGFAIVAKEIAWVGPAKPHSEESLCYIQAFTEREITDGQRSPEREHF